MTTEQYGSVSFGAQQVAFARREDTKPTKTQELKVVGNITVTLFKCGNMMDSTYTDTYNGP